MFIQSTSVTAMSMFGTEVLTGGLSNVYLGKANTKLEGFIGGYALNFTTIFIEKDLSFMPAATFFATKPFPGKRWTTSPMVALSFSPVTYSTTDNKVAFNQYFSYIVGSNFDFNLSQRFKANIGTNMVGNTNTPIPVTFGFTIGSRFSF